ncbi:uncharacterized protein PWA37_005187 [Arxiozyma heterogenica]|uniref:Topoisomerase I damage affected protein 2 n=1 Tax=Arxiozyma heterogenica TaxID=278026 RepID=A0AAN7WKE9_9SACH|nr:hypothetical protein RI543_000124 [Kazachstania heterogenica]
MAGMDFQFTILDQTKKEKISKEYDVLVDRLYNKYKDLEVEDTQKFIDSLTQAITQSFDTPNQNYKYIVTLTATQSDVNSPQVDFTMATLWNNEKDDVYTKALPSINYENKFYIINIFSISKCE